MADALTADLSAPLAAFETLAPVLISLTSRERQILPLLAVGLMNHEIAATLFIGRRPAEPHASRLLAKLDVPTRTAASVARASGRLEFNRDNRLSWGSGAPPRAPAFSDRTHSLSMRKIR